MDNHLIRAELQKTNDGGEAQTVNLLGRDSEALGGKTGVIRIQMFGLSSHAPAGSHGIVLAIGGNMDQALVLGLEHADHRPKDKAEGDTVLYDAHGQSLHMKDGEVVLTCTNLTITVTGAVVIDCPDIHLGGAGGKPVAVQGTTTSDGATLTGAFAARVKAV